MKTLVLLCFTSFSFTLLRAQSFEALCKERVTLEETPGIAVAIFENNKSQFFSFGYSNLANHTPVTPKTLFEIGSITKTFTCSALAFLVQENVLSLSAPAQLYLPSSIVLPQKNGRQITLADLATAHSGLPRMPGNFSPDDPGNPYVDYTEKQLAVFLDNCELLSVPGTKYEYSNLGMGLLGFILTQKNKESYSSLVKKIILRPLDMDQTFISGETKSKLLATGYTDKNPMKAWTWNNESVLTGAGGIVSNTEDMLKYLIAQLASEQTSLSIAFQNAREERADAGSPQMQIGLGWHIRDHQYTWHNGGTAGFRSFAGFDAKKQRAIVILTNSTNGADDLGFHWLDSTYSLKAIKKSITLDPIKAKAYEGVYEITPTFRVTVTAGESDLVMQATGQSKATLYAQEPDKFFLRVVDAEVQFGRNAQGKIEKLTIYQNGIEQIARKVN